MPQRILIGIAVVVSALLAAASLLVARDTEPPGIQTIQAAYRLESAAGRIEHDASLQIASADCTASDDGYLCWVKYRTFAAPELKFDVVDLRRERSGWKLTSGLCLPPATKPGVTREVK